MRNHPDKENIPPERRIQIQQNQQTQAFEMGIIQNRNFLNPTLNPNPNVGNVQLHGNLEVPNLEDAFQTDVLPQQQLPQQQLPQVIDIAQLPEVEVALPEVQVGPLPQPQENVRPAVGRRLLFDLSEVPPPRQKCVMLVGIPPPPKETYSLEKNSNQVAFLGISFGIGLWIASIFFYFKDKGKKP